MSRSGSPALRAASTSEGTQPANNKHASRRTCPLAVRSQRGAFVGRPLPQTAKGIWAKSTG
eukprot:12952170-Alexandrium_andersonii.AAC.1